MSHFNLTYSFDRAGIFNDMGSGSNVDLVVIKANDNVQYLRGFDEANVKGTRKQKYKYAKGTTEVCIYCAHHQANTC